VGHLGREASERRELPEARALLRLHRQDGSNGGHGSEADGDGDRRGEQRRRRQLSEEPLSDGEREIEEDDGGDGDHEYVRHDQPAHVVEEIHAQGERGQHHRGHEERDVRDARCAGAGHRHQVADRAPDAEEQRQDEELSAGPLGGVRAPSVAVEAHPEVAELGHQPEQHRDGPRRLRREGLERGNHGRQKAERREQREVAGARDHQPPQRAPGAEEGDHQRGGGGSHERGGGALEVVEDRVVGGLLEQLEGLVGEEGGGGAPERGG
jgi:hypothetical protein